jgi:pimeloyl-ACP methyl ester carboxylesterase
MPAMSSSGRSVVRKRTWWSYLKVFLLGVGVLIVLLLLAGAVFQSISTNRDSRRLVAPGQMVDMGGYRLHLRCTGTGAGTAKDLTVILESGLGSTTSTWARIQHQVAQTMRVCSYDRGGIGWSDPSPRPRDAISIANELSELLRRADIHGPLVIVGHSSGGLYARAFQAQFPERVVGLVLLDSSHEDQFSRPPDGEANYRMIKNAYRIFPVAARVGLARLTPLCDLPEDFPIDARSDHHATCSRTGTWKAQRLEVESLVDANAHLRKLGELPLLVVTAGNDPQSLRNWADLQNELAALSTRSTHLVRANATHPGLLLNAEDAAYVSAATKTLVESIALKRE